MSKSKSKVRVAGDEAGNVVVISSKNSEYGTIRVVQDRAVFDESGFARKKTLSALIAGKVSDLKSFGWKVNDELDGKIVIRESLTPFNPKDPDRDFKVAGKSNIVCCLDGEPIYRKTFYTENLSVEDEIIAHNNTDAIRAAFLEEREKVQSEAEGAGFNV
jgi:hypothetical protein